MSEVVVGVDPVALVIGYLNPIVTPPVVSRVPTQRPSRFYRVNAAGGPGMTSRVLFRAVVTVEAWSTDKAQAMTDCLLAVAHLEASHDFYAEASAPVFLPDPDSDTPRCISTVQLAVRGNIL